MVDFVWSEGLTNMRDVWKFASTRPGEPSVTTSGHCLMLTWSADNSDTQQQVLFCWCKMPVLYIYRQMHASKQMNSCYS